MCHPSGLVLVEAVSALCSFLVRVRVSRGVLWGIGVARREGGCIMALPTRLRLLSACNNVGVSSKGGECFIW